MRGFGIGAGCGVHALAAALGLAAFLAVHREACFECTGRGGGAAAGGGQRRCRRPEGGTGRAESGRRQSDARRTGQSRQACRDRCTSASASTSANL